MGKYLVFTYRSGQLSGGSSKSTSITSCFHCLATGIRGCRKLGKDLCTAYWEIVPVNTARFSPTT